MYQGSHTDSNSPHLNPQPWTDTHRVQNKLTEEDVRKRAEELSFPSSVVEYFQVPQPSLFAL